MCLEIVLTHGTTILTNSYLVPSSSHCSPSYFPLFSCITRSSLWYVILVLNCLLYNASELFMIGTASYYSNSRNIRNMPCFYEPLSVIRYDVEAKRSFSATWYDINSRQGRKRLRISLGGMYFVTITRQGGSYLELKVSCNPSYCVSANLNALCSKESTDTLKQNILSTR